MKQGPAVKTPKLFAWIGSAAVIATIIAVQALPRGSSATLHALGVPVLFVAGVLVFWPLHLLAKHGEVGREQSYMQTTIVVDRGLYAITRHPQYLGYMLLACGFALLSQHWITWLLAALGVTCFYLQSAQEETTCRTRLGESYARYCERVPRFNLVLGLLRLMQGGPR